MGERKLFGTDGVRGKANHYPMTCEVATALGRAVTYYFQKTSKRNKKPLIIVGKDTRLSCYMLEQALSAGVCSQGGHVILTGPLPTPGVAFATESMRAEAGIMISASHNSFGDNGIKIFDHQGYKLPDNVEYELEQMVLDPSTIPTVSGEDIGSAQRLDEVIGRYIVQVKSALPVQYNLEGMRIVLDCANGAAYKVGPMVFSELGAEVFTIGVEPNGRNINERCGSLHTELCQKKVVEYRADFGICLDGDADRLIIIDSNGMVIDGDKIIGLCARLMFLKHELKSGDEVIGTVMTNLGLEHYLKSMGLLLKRTNVGDRYIMEYMKNNGSPIGGEPSGHIIFKNHATTGDGILAALKVIECVKFFGKSINELTEDIKLYPQILKNIRVTEKKPFQEIPAIQKILEEIDVQFRDNVRTLLRYSGTEHLARVMVEGKNEDQVFSVCDRIVKVVQEELA